MSGLAPGRHRFVLLSPLEAFGPDQVEVELGSGQGEFRVLFAQDLKSVLYGKPRTRAARRRPSRRPGPPRALMRRRRGLGRSWRACAAPWPAGAGRVRGATRCSSVARELVDPPFYKPQPLARVEATYRELARGDGADPGGAWETRAMGTQVLWRLRRRTPAPGVVLLLHGFGDDRWGTSPALRWFPDLDAAIFTYLRRDEAIRAGRRPPPVTFGARESQEVVDIVHGLEAQGTPREPDPAHGPQPGRQRRACWPWPGWSGRARAPWAASSGKGPRPAAGISPNGWCAVPGTGSGTPCWPPASAPWPAAWRAAKARYRPEDTDLLAQTGGLTLRTPGLCFLATQDRLAPPAVQRQMAGRFARIRVVEVPTWHLHCSEILGPAYATAIQEATRSWLP